MAAPQITRFHALLIGIDDYVESEDLPLKPLPGSVHDVECMAAFLEERFGATACIERCTAPRHGTAGLRPTLAVIRAHLAQLLARVQVGDQALVYFSGHGLRLPTCRSLPGGPPLDECFVPADVAPPLEKAVLRDFELAEWTRALAEQGALVTLLIDCCHSGGAARDLDGAFGVQEFDVPGLPRALRCRSSWLPEASTGMVFLGACQPHQEAHQRLVGTRFQGYMTYCLVEALRALGPEATWDLVHRRVVAAVHREIGHQTPHLEGERQRLALGWGVGSPQVDEVEGLDVEPHRLRWTADSSLEESFVAVLSALAGAEDLLQERDEEERQAITLERLVDGPLVLREPGGCPLLEFQPTAPPREVCAGLGHLARYRYVEYLENPLSTIWRGLALEIERAEGACTSLDRWAEGTAPRGYLVPFLGEEALELRLRNRGHRVLYCTLFNLQPGWEITQVYPEDSWNLPLEGGAQTGICIDTVAAGEALPAREMLLIFVSTEAVDLRAFELSRWAGGKGVQGVKSAQECTAQGFTALREILETAGNRSRSPSSGGFWDWTVERIYFERTVPT